MFKHTHCGRATRICCEGLAADVVQSTPVSCNKAGFADRIADPSSSRSLHDPAVVIGLTMALVRQTRIGNDAASASLLLPLQDLADSGDPACRLLVRWLQHRNRDLWPADIIAADNGVRADG